MFNINEKSLADNRTLISTQSVKDEIDILTKNGTIHYTSKDSNLWLTTPKIRTGYVMQDPEVRSYFDKVLLARNGLTINDSYEFKDMQSFLDNVEISKNLVIKGNLSVLGESSVIDTPSLVIEDNIIELNRNEKGDGISLLKSGTAFNRGKLGYARILFDETRKAFVVDTPNTIDESVTEPLITIISENNSHGEKGEVIAKAKITAPSAYISSKLEVLGQSTLNTLSVNGESNFSEIAKFSDAVTITKTLGVTGAATLGSSLNVTGATTVSGQLYAKSTFRADGAITAKSTASFEKAVTMLTTLGVIGATTLSSTLDVAGNATLSGDVGISGMLTGTSVKANTINADNINLTNNAVIDKNLTVKGASSLSALTVSGVTTLNGTTNINAISNFDAKVNITHSVDIKKRTDGSQGNLTVDGTILTNYDLIAKGAISSNKSISADESVNSKVFNISENIKFTQGNEKGISLWNTEDNKIYMSEKAHTSGGVLKAGDTTTENLYLRTTGTKGFVFKNGISPTAQIDQDGNIYAKSKMYSNGSVLLAASDMGHAPGAGKTAINADMVDGKHSSDILLRDGTQAMTGNLKMGTNKIVFSDDDTFSFTDDTVTYNEQEFKGMYYLNADSSDAMLSVSGLNAGGMIFNGKAKGIFGIDKIASSKGIAISMADSWLRLNDTSAHTSGILTGTSLVRSDNGFQIGASGATLNANSTAFTYKGSNVITAAGGKMTGDLDMGTSKITFTGVSQSGTVGMASSDYGNIYGEHDENTENSRFVIEVRDNGNDAIVLRTSSTGTEKNDALVVDNTKATFKNNPYFGGNRLLHTGDLGAGAGLNADMVDGKHYSDLQSEFLAKTGGTMSGNLVITKTDATIVLNSPLSKTALTGQGGRTYLQSGTDLSNSGSVHITGYSSAKLAEFVVSVEDKANAKLNGFEILTKQDYGHSKGIDADTIDGKHFSDIDATYLKLIGGTLTGDVAISYSKKMLLGTSSLRSGSSEANQSLVVSSVNGIYFRPNGDVSSNEAYLSSSGVLTLNGSRTLTVADYGHSNEINADMVDGKHATDFATSTHDHDAQYVQKTEINLNNKFKIEYNETSDSLDFMYVS